MSLPSIVVVDINGVLGDVCRFPVQGRKADVMLANGQYFYMRPGAVKFIDGLIDLVGLSRIIVWTSRVRRNAMPIERLFEEELALHFQHTLHGEDCAEYVGYHPIKNVEVIRKCIGAKNAHIVFVDNHPDFVKVDDNSTVLHTMTYDANAMWEDIEELDRTLKIVESIVCQHDSQ